MASISMPERSKKAGIDRICARIFFLQSSFGNADFEAIGPQEQIEDHYRA